MSSLTWSPALRSRVQLYKQNNNDNSNHMNSQETLPKEELVLLQLFNKQNDDKNSTVKFSVSSSWM
jgi:hypothetical protein